MDSNRPSPSGLRTEHLIDPLGIDAHPRLSWLTSLPGRGERQTAYRIAAAGSRDRLDRGEHDLWDTGRVESADSVLVPYAGADPGSRGRVWWRVMIWNKDGAPGEWSPPAWFEMGLMSAQDWTARWISLPLATDTRDGLTLPPVRYLRRAFRIGRPVKRARIYATARGVYKLRVNGRPVGDAEFAPGWTDYRKRIQYQTYDVTNLLQAGDNAVGAMLGDGWYCGYVGYDHRRDYYGETPELLAQLMIDYEDGTAQTISTDADWDGETGPILYSDMLMGERYDARMEMDGWDRPEFRPDGWMPVTTGSVGAMDGIPLVAQPDSPARVTEEITPLAVRCDDHGRWLVDMGQNMVGRVRLKVAGKAGAVITLRYAEMLDDDGGIYTLNLRSARSTDQYVVRGSIGYRLGGQTGPRLEVWEPHFTFHGFRYVEIDGYPDELTPELIVGLVIESETEPAGSLETGHPMVNQLVKNIVWGQRGNYLSVPTDCPQRNERLGWMGDAQVFVRTATYNRNVAAFFTKWLRDVADAQSEDGGFPDWAPRLDTKHNGSPAWADAGVICPWAIYLAYGDRRILEEMYEPMKRWIQYLEDANPNHLWVNRRYKDHGDWLSIDADTPKDLIGTAYYAWDCLLMSRIAEALVQGTPAADEGEHSSQPEARGPEGRPRFRSADGAAFYDKYLRIRRAFIEAYVWDDGRVQGETQTAYLLALRFGLVPDSLREAAAVRLIADLDAHDDHLTTGFVGVSLLCPALAEIGCPDLAYRVLLKDTFPSWGYSIKHGATTIWERWDGWTAEKGFQDPAMNSFNHYSLGSIGEWLYAAVAGIDTVPEAPGYRCIRMRPLPNRSIGYAKARYQSPYGPIESHWRYDDAHIVWRVRIPSNATAVLDIPTSDPLALTEGGKPIDGESIYMTTASDSATSLVVESGSYEFRWLAESGRTCS